jgi:acyl-CoA reductase-like NAD-dependent aldehyde dehydrogenase
MGYNMPDKNGAMTRRMWIGGEWVEAVSEKKYQVINPATEEEIAQIPLGDERDVDKAVAASRKAFPVWSRKSQAERSGIMLRIAQTIRDNAQELGELDTLEHGTPIKSAVHGIEFAAERIEYTAQVARGFMGDVLPIRKDVLFYLQREPIGVCATIIPWNVPLRQIAAKLGPALVVGNSCIIKPPSINSLVALRFGELLEELDILPPGTVNIVTGPGGSVGEALASHPGVGIVSFTGSSETGKAIMSAASQTVKRLVLELGGKNPFIVLEDADVDAAIAKAIFASYRNTGQVCASPGRYYICEKLHDEFVDKFVSLSKKIVVGDPTDIRTDMGPVVSMEHRDKVEGYIRAGIKEGANLLLGGKRPQTPPLNKGFFVMPTVFSGVTQNMKIAREEIFGPVACIMKFSSEDEVIEAANDSEFGLCASIWTKTTSKAIRFANEIQAGFVWVNDHLLLTSEQPWGGFKQSGFGKDNSVMSLQEYTQVKAVSIQI